MLTLVEFVCIFVGGRGSSSAPCPVQHAYIMPVYAYICRWKGVVLGPISMYIMPKDREFAKQIENAIPGWVRHAFIVSDTEDKRVVVQQEFADGRRKGARVKVRVSVVYRVHEFLCLVGQGALVDTIGVRVCVRVCDACACGSNSSTFAGQPLPIRCEDVHMAFVIEIRSVYCGMKGRCFLHHRSPLLLRSTPTAANVNVWFLRRAALRH